MRDRAGLMRRRELLLRGGALAAVATMPGVLAACGGSDSTGTTGDAGGEVGGTLRMLSWEGYDLPDGSQAWREQNGVTLNSTYVGSNDEIAAKTVAAKQSGQAIDFITYNQGFRTQFGELAILEPIDVEQIPGYEGLFPFFSSQHNNFWVDADGTVRGVPFLFGWNGITFDSSVVEEPGSYEMLLDPQYKGKVALNEDVMTLYQTASKALNLDPAKLTDADFGKVEDWLKAMLAQTSGVSPTIGDMVTKLSSGDVVFALPGWPGMNSLAADAGKKTIKSVLPSEGGVSFCDAIAIPPTAENVATAYAWIDFTCDPATSAETATYLVGGTPIAAAAPKVSKSVSAGYDYDDIEKLFETAPLYDNPPIESDQYKTVKDFNDSWTQLKAQN